VCALGHSVLLLRRHRKLYWFLLHANTKDVYVPYRLPFLKLLREGIPGHDAWGGGFAVWSRGFGSGDGHGCAVRMRSVMRGTR